MAPDAVCDPRPGPTARRFSQLVACAEEVFGKSARCLTASRVARQSRCWLYVYLHVSHVSPVYRWCRCTFPRALYRARLCVPVTADAGGHASKTCHTTRSQACALGLRKGGAMTCSAE